MSTRFANTLRKLRAESGPSHRELGVDALPSAAAEHDEAPNVIMVDDREIALTGGLAVLEEAMPDATIVGFTRPSEAVEYAKDNKVALAFLEIDLRSASGLDLCRALLEINPRTNVVFLTAYAGHSLEAWGTGASGFMLKPITQEGIREQLERLRYPFLTDANRGQDPLSNNELGNAPMVLADNGIPY